VPPSHEFAKNWIGPKSKALTAAGPTLSNTLALQTSDGASGRDASFSVFRGLGQAAFVDPFE